MTVEYNFDWLPTADWITDELVLECSELFSSQYGEWSTSNPHGFVGNIKRSPDKIRELLSPESASIAIARYNGELVGYAIAVQSKVEKSKDIVSWITQFVVHSDHRRSGVGKRLLFSFWRFSDHHCWGLLSCNPYAIRALEKATRRRCNSARIKKNHKKLFNHGIKTVEYVNKECQISCSVEGACINTNFHIDHSSLDEFINSASRTTPWVLGNLEEGWEWFAFTFNDQDQIQMSADEIREMISTSDSITQKAYLRMEITPQHEWAKYASQEVDSIIRSCGITSGSVLDLGCGVGRHTKVFSDKGYQTTGVDYTASFIFKAKQNDPDTNYLLSDCRTIQLEQKFDIVACLYDVIGTFLEHEENIAIIENIKRHLKPGGHAFISVMNFELTKRNAKNFFSLKESPQELLSLPPSTAMQTTGEVFDPDYYMIDTDDNIVYRKEQFVSKGNLPEEYIIRDKRFSKEEISNMCFDAGLSVEWTRYVRAGKWETSDEFNGKEILVCCQLRD